MTYDERTASICTTSAQATAAKLLALEIQCGAWPMPTKKADILAAVEARYEQLTAKLRDAALACYTDGPDRVTGKAPPARGEPKPTQLPDDPFAGK